MVHKTLVLRLITGVRCQIIICYIYILPGPMEGSLRSLQTDERPPGSMEWKRGLNPIPLQTLSGGSFALFSSPNIMVSVFILGFPSGKWTIGKKLTAGTTILSRAAGR